MPDKTIDKLLGQIAELPTVDYVHCYDYEIRTDDLKALCTAYLEQKARLEKAEALLAAATCIDLVGGYSIEKWNDKWEIYDAGANPIPDTFETVFEAVDAIQEQSK